MSSLVSFLESGEQRLQTQSEEEIIQEWRESLDIFFSRIISDWLSEAISKKHIRVHKETILLQEQTLGEYSVPSLQIEIRSAYYLPATIEVTPYARLVLGGSGRVDIVSHVTGQRFVLLRHKQREWAYFDRSTANTTELDEALFNDLLIKSLVSPS